MGFVDAEHPKIGELFAGYGGLGLGVQEVYGGEVTWVAEIDPSASLVLAERIPGSRNLGDVSEVSWSGVEKVDILAGGFPCQDVSAAGHRRGMLEGNRSGLWYEMVRAIEELRPPLVVIENVRGLFSARSYCYVGPGGESLEVRAIDAVLGTLCNLGYDAQWTTLRASDVGAPHLRDRVFISAHLRGDSAEPRGLVEGLPRAPRGVKLLPTPTSSLGSSGSIRRSGARRDELLLGGLATFGHLEPGGPYREELERWGGVLGRTAPSPTAPGRGGAPRLAPGFVEWMMGLPEGWVTGVEGLDRRDQLRVLGNGVVPRQAAVALSQLSHCATV